MKLTKSILMEVEQERINQIINHNEDQSKTEMFINLTEGVGQIATTLQNYSYWTKESVDSELYKILIQVAALSVKMAEGVKKDGTTT